MYAPYALAHAKVLDIFSAFICVCILSKACDMHHKAYGAYMHHMPIHAPYALAHVKVLDIFSAFTCVCILPMTDTCIYIPVCVCVCVRVCVSIRLFIHVTKRRRAKHTHTHTTTHTHTQTHTHTHTHTHTGAVSTGIGGRGWTFPGVGPTQLQSRAARGRLCLARAGHHVYRMVRSST